MEENDLLGTDSPVTGNLECLFHYTKYLNRPKLSDTSYFNDQIGHQSYFW